MVADAVLTQWYESRYGLMGGVANITLGYFAKLLPLPIVTPSQVLTNRMQTSAAPLGLIGAYREVIRTSGYRGLWAGAESYIVLAIWPALEMLIFDQFKRVILRSQGLPLHSELSGGVAFLLGAAGRFTATTIVSCNDIAAGVWVAFSSSGLNFSQSQRYRVADRSSRRSARAHCARRVSTRQFQLPSAGCGPLAASQGCTKAWCRSWLEASPSTP